MGYLILGFSCSALVSIVLKASGNLDHDRYGMLTVNYMACLIPFIISQIGRDLPAMDLDFGICIAAAAANSLLYIAGMVMNQINARRSGAILQSAFARLGVMVPVLISIIAFGERPTAMQTIAIALVLIAFCIIGMLYVGGFWDPETEGYPMHMAEMIAQLKRPAFCGRFAAPFSFNVLRAARTEPVPHSSSVSLPLRHFLTAI